MKTKRCAQSVLSILQLATLLWLQGCDDTTMNEQELDTEEAADTDSDPDTNSDSDSDTIIDTDIDEGTIADKVACGTSTPSSLIPGDMDCEGSCEEPLRVGYMRFDLSDYPLSENVTEARLQLHVEVSSSPWGWIIGIDSDPAKDPPEQVFDEITAHEDVCSWAQTFPSSGSWEVDLTESGVDRIVAALAEEDPSQRWVAFAWSFE